MNKLASNIKGYILRRRRDLLWWAGLIVAVVLIQHWQTRDLLAKTQTAPAFTLVDLEGKERSLEEFRGRAVVVYFFAPWCTICKATSSNIAYLRKLRGGEKLGVLTVALSYSNTDEVRGFAKDHGLTGSGVPVMLGDASVGDNYKIEAFPTVYFIDAKGEVRSSSMGYISTLGLWVRSVL